MKKKSVKYLQGFNLSQLTLSEKNEVKDLCPTTPNLVMSQSSSSIIQTCMRKFNRCIQAKQKSLCDCGERLKDALY